MNVQSRSIAPSEAARIGAESAFLANEWDQYHGGYIADEDEPSECQRCQESFDFDHDTGHWIIPAESSTGEGYCSERCRLQDALDIRHWMVRQVEWDIKEGDIKSARRDAFVLARYANAMYGDGAAEEIIEEAV